MRRTCSVFLPLLAALLGACLGATPSAAGSGASPPEQWSGAYGGAEEPGTRVVRAAAEWRDLWNRLGRDAPRPLGAREQAVAVFLGQRRTGGYRAEIAGTRIEDGQLIVDYRERTPDPNRSVTQALTTPWAVAIVPLADLPVVARKLPADDEGREGR